MKKIRHITDKDKRIAADLPSLADQVAALMDGGAALDAMKKKIKDIKIKYKK